MPQVGVTDTLPQREEILPSSPISPEPIQPTPSTPEKKGNKKLIFLIISTVVLVFLLCAGIYYYYLEIFKPPQDAKQIIRLYEDLQRSEQLMGNNNIQDAADYVEVLDILNKREESLLRTQNRLLDIKLIKNILPESFSPRAHKIKETYQDFSGLIEVALVVNADAKQKATFLESALGLLVALGRYAPRVQQAQERENVLDPRQPRTVETVLGDWEMRISRAKEVGTNFFAKESPPFTQVDSQQLKTAWEKANMGFNDLLAYLRAQDQSATISSQSIVPRPQTEQEQQQYKGIEDLNQFIVLVDSILNANRAQDILAYQSPSPTLPQDFKDLASKVEKQISELKQLWPQEDWDKKTQELVKPSR